MNKDYYRRSIGIVDSDRLASLRLVVTGVGAGGGQVVDEIGRWGSSVLIIDRPTERLETHNVMRHVLGADAIGEIKHVAMARHVQRLCPFTSVTSVGIDVLQERDQYLALLQAFEPHLIFAATDNEPSKFAIDEIGRILRIPVVGAGVYNGGVGGEVYLTEPGAACYGCIFEHLQGGSAERHAPQSVDYSNPEQPDVPATAALRLDIGQIAGLSLRMAMQRLLAPGQDAFGVPSGANVVVWANRRVPGVFERALTPQWLHIDPDPRCLYCAKGSSPISDPNRNGEKGVA